MIVAAAAAILIATPVAASVPLPITAATPIMPMQTRLSTIWQRALLPASSSTAVTRQ